MQGLAKAIAFGQKAGLDMKAVLDVIGKGAAQSWQMDNRGTTMIEGKFDFGFAVDWMRKDLGLVLDEARRNGARLPVTALVDQFYADLQAQGGESRRHLEPDQAAASAEALRAARPAALAAPCRAGASVFGCVCVPVPLRDAPRTPAPPCDAADAARDLGGAVASRSVTRPIR